MLVGAAVLGCTASRTVVAPLGPHPELAADSISWLTETERYVLVSGYRGPLVVLYNDSGGTSGEVYRASRTYRVPATGVLRIRDHNPSPNANVHVLIPDGRELFRVRMYEDCYLPMPWPRYGCWLPHVATSRMPAPYPFYISGLVGPIRDVHAECARAMVVVDSVVFGGKLRELRKCRP